jgi:hypothetical protein
MLYKVERTSKIDTKIDLSLTLQSNVNGILRLKSRIQMPDKLVYPQVLSPLLLWTWEIKKQLLKNTLQGKVFVLISFGGEGKAK